MNLIIKLFTEKLKNLKSRLADINEETEYNQGRSLALLCMREAIDTRIDLVIDIHTETGNDAYTNAQFASFCTEYTNELENIFSELSSEMSNNEFGRGYKYQVRKFLELLRPIQDWLKRVMLAENYTS